MSSAQWKAEWQLQAGGLLFTNAPQFLWGVILGVRTWRHIYYYFMQRGAEKKLAALHEVESAEMLLIYKDGALFSSLLALLPSADASTFAP